MIDTGLQCERCGGFIDKEASYDNEYHCHECDGCGDEYLCNYCYQEYDGLCSVCFIEEIKKKNG